MTRRGEGDALTYNETRNAGRTRRRHHRNAKACIRPASNAKIPVYPGATSKPKHSRKSRKRYGYPVLKNNHEGTAEKYAGMTNRVQLLLRSRYFRTKNGNWAKDFGTATGAQVFLILLNQKFGELHETT